MGRPLLSTLIAPTPAPTGPPVHVATVETPTYERWSYLNPFDPDSDEFFEGPDVVYEAFLSPEEISEQRESELDQRIQEQIAIRNRLLELLDSSPVAEGDSPDLVESSEEDSSSASSFSSGRTTPINAVNDVRDRQTTDGMPLTHDAPRGSEAVARDLDDHVFSDLPPLVSPPRSLPTTPTRVSPRSALPFDVADVQFSPLTALAAQASPALMSPTPPSHVTPRVLHWPLRPRAVNMSPSPTPNAPLGSARAALMGFVDPHAPPYFAPALRVHQ